MLVKHKEYVKIEKITKGHPQIQTHFLTTDRKKESINFMERLKNQEEHGGIPENRLEFTTGKKEGH